MGYTFLYQDDKLYCTHCCDEHPHLNHSGMHTHERAELHFFISVDGFFHVEGSEYTVGNNDILITRPHEAHYIDVNNDILYERVVVNFDPDILKSIDPEGVLTRAFFSREQGKQNLFKSTEFKNSNYKNYIKNMVKPVTHKRISVISHLIPLLYELYAVFSSRNLDQDDGQTDTVEYRIIHYINQNLESEITLDGICNRFYISKSQLCRMFKRATGSTVWDYITLKRLIAARQLILSGARPTEIFTNCGFKDYSTFYRAYCKRFGHSPKNS